MSTGTSETLHNNEAAYYRVGGTEAIKAVVDRFYELVLAHAELAPYFTKLDADGMARLKRHQVILVSHVLGGPVEYDVSTLGATHAALDIAPVHYRMVVHLLVGTLWEFKVPEDIIFSVGELLASLQPVIAPGTGVQPQEA